MTLNNMAHITCDKGPEMMALAVRSKFITPQQQQEMLPQILAHSKEDPKALLAPFLLEKKFLPKEDIQLLFSIKNHLQVLMADRQFGKLGIVNQFVSPDKVKQALEVQVKIFQKRKTSVKIGDILMQSQDISPADNTALLLTQDRVPEELLSQAIYTIAKTEMDQMEIEQRFGAIAVKKELITAGQLSQALKLQEREVAENSTKRYLGDILKEMAGLSDQDITGILKVQRKIETQRMKLEEKLTQYNLQKEAERQALAPFFSYRVAEDHLTAFIRKHKLPDTPIDLPRFLNWFALSGICFGLTEAEQVQDFLESGAPGEEFKIARGLPPRPHKKEKVVFKFPHKGPGSRDAADRAPVAAQALLAIVSPQQEPRPGTDVFGREIPPPGKPAVRLTCGEGVTRKGDQFFALVAGIPRVGKDGILNIMAQDPGTSGNTETLGGTPASQRDPGTQDSPVSQKDPGLGEATESPAPGKESPLGQKAAGRPEPPPQATPPPAAHENDQPRGAQKKQSPRAEEGVEIVVIQGDITADTLEQYTRCSLRVTGSIGPGILVSCHDLVVEGDLLGSLSLSGDLVVKGNMGAKPAQGQADPPPVQVTAKGGIQVSGSILHSKIFAGNGLVAPKADLFRSQVSSCRDVVVNNILSTPEAPSTVRMVSENILEKAEMEKLDAAVKKAADALDALLPEDDLKDLTLDLMRKKAALKKYQEKQEVLSYLSQVVSDPDLGEVPDPAGKVAAFEEKRGGDDSPQRPKGDSAQKYLEFLLVKLEGLDSEKQVALLEEFQDSAAGMHRAARKTREKLTAKHQALAQEQGKEAGTDDAGIHQASRELDRLKQAREALVDKQKRAGAQPPPVVKVKNQVDAATIILGENTRLVIDKTIYRVAFVQEAATPRKQAQIVVKGYFD